MCRDNSYRILIYYESSEGAERSSETRRGGSMYYPFWLFSGKECFSTGQQKLEMDIGFSLSLCVRMLGNTVGEG